MSTTMPFEPTGAVLSDDGLYRYSLTRRWHIDGPVICWVMLNPSTADALVDDPTIRRVRGFSQQWGFSALGVVNLYAWRATNPKDLGRVADPVGPLNIQHIDRAATSAAVTVAAWGANAPAAEDVREVLAGIDLRCLGTTKDGHPRHPLYVKGDAQLERWAPTDRQGVA